MSLPYYNYRSLAPIFYVFPLFTGQSAGSPILQQDLYQIFLISFLVNASSFGGDPPSPCLRRTGKPRPYNWWWAVPTQTLLVEKLIPLIFRLQSSSTFRMVGYIVFNHQQVKRAGTPAPPFLVGQASVPATNGNSYTIKIISTLLAHFLSNSQKIVRRNKKHGFALVRIQTSSHGTTAGHLTTL